MHQLVQCARAAVLTSILAISGAAHARVDGPAGPTGPPGDPIGACCFPDGSCLDLTQVDCEKGGGLYQGDFTTCSADGSLCVPFGSCCYGDGACAYGVDEESCLSDGGIYQGDGVMSCAECPGACCLLDQCQDGIGPSECAAMDGDYQGLGTDCATAVCAFGACCLPGFMCAGPFDQSTCESIGGIYQGDGTEYCEGSCPGACCLPDSCVETNGLVCASIGGVYRGDDTFCGKSGCTGACCLPGGVCAVHTPFECSAAGGSFQGFDTFCEGPCGLFQPPRETPAAAAGLSESGGELNSALDADGGDGFRDVAGVLPGGDPTMPGQVQAFINRGTDGAGGWLGFTPKDPVPVGLAPVGAALALLDGDSFSDLAVANSGDDSVSLLFNSGDGQGTLVPGTPITGDFISSPSAIAAGNFIAGLGSPTDLAIANLGNNTVVLLENDGNGTFGLGAPAIGFDIGPISVDPIDIDNDKDEDIVVGQGPDLGSPGTGGIVSIFRRLDSSTYATRIDRAVGAVPIDLDSGDLDGNGHVDIVSANMGDGTVSIILNNGPTPDPEDGFDQSFPVGVGVAPESVAVVDVDGDGRLDIAVTATDAVLGPVVQVLLNTGAAADGGKKAPLGFAAPQSFSVGQKGGPADPNFVIGRDVNLDGAFDLITINADQSGPTPGSVSVLLGTNTPPPPVDCNDNGIADECDIASGRSEDCNGNGVPDECDTAPVEDPATAVAENDCPDAHLVCPGIPYVADTTGATQDGPRNCGVKFGILDVWYRYRPAWNGLAFISIFGAPNQPVLNIYDGCPQDDGVSIICNSINPFGVNVHVERGREYWIRIAGQVYETGQYPFSILGPDCILNDDDVNGDGVPDVCQCFADVNQDGVVDANDFLIVLLNRGPCPPGAAECPGDIDGSGAVDDTDLREVLLNLGPCPSAPPFGPEVGPVGCP